jgi:hypothetical protein
MDMKKRITKILVSILVLTAIAACGANPRGNRSNLNVDDAKRSALGEQALSDSDLANTDYYRYSVGSQDPNSTSLISNVVLYQNYGISVDGLGINTMAGTTFVEVRIAILKTTRKCGMDVLVSSDSDADGTQDVYHFEGTETVASSATSILCTVSDAVSTVNIQILPQGAALANVTIIDTFSATLPFVTGASFQVNPKESN